MACVAAVAAASASRPAASRRSARSDWYQATAAVPPRARTAITSRSVKRLVFSIASSSPDELQLGNQPVAGAVLGQVDLDPVVRHAPVRRADVLDGRVDRHQYHGRVPVAG